MSLIRVSLFLLLALCTVAVPGALYADDAANDAILEIKCDPPIPSGQLTEGVYNCIRDILDRLSEDFVTTVFEKALVGITAALTLAIAFFGFKFVLMGTRQPKAEFLMFMFKLSIVASLLFGIQSGGGILDFRDMVLNAGQDFASMTLTDTEAFGGGDNIFQKVDQMIYKVVGVENLSEVDQDKDIATIAMVGGLIFAGPLGSKAFADTGAVIGMLLYAFVLALYINIIALVALTFLFTLSPIILPMALFPYTSYITQNWFKQIISYSFQPMIVTAFLSMMLIVINSLFGSFQQTIDKSKAMMNNPNIAKFKILTTMGEVEKNPNKPDVEENSGSGFGGITDGFTSATAGMEVMGVMASRQVDMISKGGAAQNLQVPILPLTPKDISDLMSGTFILLLVAGAMMAFMRELPAWASELAGGDRVTPSLAASQPMEDIKQNYAPEVRQARKRA